MQINENFRSSEELEKEGELGRKEIVEKRKERWW